MPDHDVWSDKNDFVRIARAIEKLRDMPERTTRDELLAWASALRRASQHLEQLTRTRPHGCTCRYHEDDDRSWVTPDPQCPHHKHQIEERAALAKHYAKQHTKLTNEIRLRLVTAAITGLASKASVLSPDGIATEALQVADAVIAKIEAEP